MAAHLPAIMASTISADVESARPSGGPRLDKKLPPAGRWLFVALLLGGLLYAGFSIVADTGHVGEQMRFGVFAFLVLALIIALGFEFVNGFHDTANAVATVIYTHSLPAPLAVLWSGAFNFLGVVLSSGAVAYSIVTLLPVNLILNVGSYAGFAMIFALLLAAILWNLATWYAGIPNSSSHALIGSILGVGLANQLLTAGSGGASGVDWSQAWKVLSSLLVSPLMGFVGAMLLLWAMRLVIRSPKLYTAPEGETPPPWGIRALLIGTCTAVSFAHGGNDGQKGMGLIMLILIGCAPTAYALNRTVPESATPMFVQASTRAAAALHAHAGAAPAPSVEQARKLLAHDLQIKKAGGAPSFAAAETLSRDIAQRLGGYGSLRKVPAAETPNLRNDMYLVLDATRLSTTGEDAAKTFPGGELKAIQDYQGLLEQGTRYIPVWVKIAVALALGLGTMIGWKRIVVTVGERIGKTHMTYGMGAAAEIVAAATILLAERYGMPVSTTHILTSGVAGASVANGAGLQRKTIMSLVLAWVLTLPVAMLLAGLLYWLLLTLVHLLGG